MWSVRKFAMMLSVVGATVHSPADAGIVAHWRFDEPDGASTLVDSTGGFHGTGANGLVASGGTSNGQIGGAWEFAGGANNGDHEFVDLGAHVGALGTLTQGTISAWVKPATTGLTTDVLTIFSASDVNAPSTEVRWFVSNGGAFGTGNLVYGVRGGTNNAQIVSSGVNLLDDNWHHVAVTVGTGSAVNLFIDGENVGSGTADFFGGLPTVNGMAIGRNRNNTPGGGRWFYDGLIDDLQLYDQPLPASAITQIYQAGLQGQSLEIAGIPEAIVDRDTGNITFMNNGDPITIVGYSFASAQGALNPAQWLSIADNYDASNPGPDQIDPNDEWVKLTDPNSRTDLSELEPVGDGAVIGFGQSVNFGNAWIKNPVEDIALQVLRDDLSIDSIPVKFVGNGGQPIAPGDFNFDGIISVADWIIFRTNQHADLSGLSLAEAYQLGDLTGDRHNTHADFVAFKALFEAANGAGSFAAMLATLNVTVPEPSAIILVMTAGLAALPLMRRRRSRELRTSVNCEASIVSRNVR